MEDKRVKLSMISSEQSLADIVTLSRQVGTELPALEVIKLTKVSIAVDYWYNSLSWHYVFISLLSKSQ